MAYLDRVFDAFDTFLCGIDDLSPSDLDLLKEMVNNVSVGPGCRECYQYLNDTMKYITTQIDWKINNPIGSIPDK
jgi:hypothetical protein